MKWSDVGDHSCGLPDWPVLASHSLAVLSKLPVTICRAGADGTVVGGRLPRNVCTPGDVLRDVLWGCIFCGDKRTRQFTCDLRPEEAMIDLVL